MRCRGSSTGSWCVVGTLAASAAGLEVAGVMRQPHPHEEPGRTPGRNAPCRWMRGGAGGHGLHGFNACCASTASVRWPEATGLAEPMSARATRRQRTACRELLRRKRGVVPTRTRYRHDAIVATISSSTTMCPPLRDNAGAHCTARPAYDRLGSGMESGQQGQARLGPP